MTAADKTRGAHHLGVALLLAALAWLAMAFQEILLFTRPTPYGGPYVAHVARYFPYALFYNVLGVMLVSTPALLLWLWWYNRPVTGRVAGTIHFTQLGLLMLAVALDQLDNEIMRFMGIHLSRSLILTYLKVNAWGSEMAWIVLNDKGGPGLPFVILFGVPLLLWWTGRWGIRTGASLPRLRRRPIAAALALTPLLFPLYMYNFRPMGEFRKLRVQPAIVTLYGEFGDDLAAGDRPPQFEALAREYQQHWFLKSGDTAWKFSDPARPLSRVPLSPAAPVDGKPWNVIYIQLETFRGWNTGFLRPDLPTSATPFLDRLSGDSASAFWRRHLSMGPPTVSGFISGLCSVKPHSFHNITTAFTYTTLDCLPQVLRRHGYAAEHFTGFDPDWDGETLWMERWYDEHRYYGAGGDRVLFRHAAQRIRELARGSRPFMVGIASASNHLPFRSPEPEFQLDSIDRPDLAINNTMRYTDDVVREFIESLRHEPWFARTLVVITGDHGYNLGEHGPPGQASGWRESVWVPLLIHGAHPRLPRGGHDVPASLLDIAPTVTDLLGIREATPWMGTSLLTQGTQPSFVLRRKLSIYGEQGRYSMVVDPTSGWTLLYDALDDPIQTRDISRAHPDLAATLRRRAENESRLIDYLLEANLIWQDSASTPRREPTKALR